MKRHLTEKDAREAEANYFALCLLMPEDWFRADWGTDDNEQIDDRVARMAKRYDVEAGVVIVRAVGLELIRGMP